MSIEIILFGVVALVLVLDFALKGIKKKTTQDDVERIGEEQSKKKAFNLNYILERKRNILTFILLVILFKPLIHFQFYPEHNIYQDIENEIKINGNSYAYDISGEHLPSFYINPDEKKITIEIHSGSCLIFDHTRQYTPLYFGEGCRIEQVSTPIKINEAFRVDANRSENYYRLESESDFYNKNHDSNLRKDYTTYCIEKLVHLNGVLNQEEIDSIRNTFPITKTIKPFLNKEIYTKNGNKIFFNGYDNPYYYFYATIKDKINLSQHIQLMFLNKIWLFAVSFASLGVLVLLFNDKIKTR